MHSERISQVRPSHFTIAALITFQLRYRLGIVAAAGLSSLAFGMRFRGDEFVTQVKRGSSSIHSRRC